MCLSLAVGLPRWLSVKESACNEGIKERQVQSLGQEDPLEEGMVTHSSTLAWGIPWTEDPGGLQSMGSQRDTTEQVTLSLLWEAVVVGRAPK